MDERREKARKITSDYFLIFDRHTGDLLGRVLNLTTRGAMMLSESPVAIPATFRCKMVMPRMVGTRKFITFDAESRWCTKNKRWKWYETGYRLFNFSEEDQKIVEELTGDWEIQTDSNTVTVTVSGR